jgi:hypothetical protein
MFREQHILRMFDDRMPRKMFGPKREEGVAGMVLRGA